MKLLAFDLPLLRYANEAVLPFFILHQTVLLYVGYFVMTWEIHDAIKWVIVFAVAGASRSRSPMPLKYDPDQDIILNSESITDQSSIGVHVVNDEEASIGKAIEFSSGANAKAESEPKVYVEMRFSAPAGRYFVWLRGKTDINSGYTDSVWAQVDDQIGTRTRSNTSPD